MFAKCRICQVPSFFYLPRPIYLSPEQQRLVANFLHFSLSIARYQASQRPMSSRSLLSCSAQEVLGRPPGRFQQGQGALPQQAPIAVQSASWAGIPGCMRAMCPKRAGHLRLILGSMSSRRVLHLQVCYVIEPAYPKNAPQATRVKSLQTIDIGLEQGPCFSAVQEDRQETRLVQAEFCNKTL